MPKFTVTDRRVIEACEGKKIDVNIATPRERFAAYISWTLPSISNPTHPGLWADVFLDVAKGCGITKL
jgi:hypothetical protein